MNDTPNVGKFETSLVGEIPVIEVSGDIDVSNVDVLETNLVDATQRDAGVVVVSLRRASYFDSRTIHVLYRFADRLETNRQRMVLVAPEDESAKRILQITGLSSAVEQFGSLDEALERGADIVRRRNNGNYDG